MIHPTNKKTVLDVIIALWSQKFIPFLQGSDERQHIATENTLDPLAIGAGPREARGSHGLACEVTYHARWLSASKQISKKYWSENDVNIPHLPLSDTTLDHSAIGAAPWGGARESLGLACGWIYHARWLSAWYPNK